MDDIAWGAITLNILFSLWVYRRVRRWAREVRADLDILKRK